MRFLAVLIALACALALFIKLAEDKYLVPFLDKLLFHQAFTPTEKAVLIKKTEETAVNSDGTEYTNLVLRFVTEGGEIKCYVTGRVYRQVCEGMEGMLTHRGTLFKCFDVGSVRIGR